MVGALARLNLAKDLLHERTKADLGRTLDHFPSTDVYRTNLAQAIEILNSIDNAIEILTTRTFAPEPIAKAEPREAVGVGVIEAPRGTLYHKVELGADGIIRRGEIVVPTGQNQISIEEDITVLVNSLLPETPRDTIAFEVEKLIRAYDPCMSCAAHFLKVEWRE
jgi:coenzyme F420-reducing hydrogenase alpha subunit